jgi:hypothetical protein
MRSALFALTGIALFAYWALGRPTFEAAASRSEWPTVIWFSATLALLAVALPVFGRMAGGGWVVRLALVAGAAIGLSSVANIFEDGLDLDWVFAVFILGELVSLVSLLALTVVIAATRRGSGRLLALVPAGTALGLVLFVYAGGITMLATWLVAAAAARLGSAARASQAVIGNPGAIDDPA